MHGIKDNLEVRYVGAAVANASNTDDNSTRIDMAGYESVMFVTAITDSAITGVGSLTVQQSDEDSDTAMADVTGTEAIATSAANDDLNGKTLVAELRNPAKRYVQANRVSATANIAFGAVFAILKPRRLPAAAHSTNLDTNYVSN